jgi:cupin superfamily acireductone dioxygenase involved in methionine salvage
MRLTIVIPDGAVYENGVSYSHLTWSGTPANVHALQWFDTNTGWIEFNDGSPQLDINSLPEWADNAMAAWTAANTPIPPAPPTPEEIQASNKEAAEILLNESDFTQLPDVNLANKQDWADYRAQVREIAKNPPTTPVVFPIAPPLIWA